MSCQRSRSRRRSPSSADCGAVTTARFRRGQPGTDAEDIAAAAAFAEAEYEVPAAITLAVAYLETQWQVPATPADSHDHAGEELGHHPALLGIGGIRPWVEADLVATLEAELGQDADALHTDAALGTGGHGGGAAPAGRRPWGRAGWRPAGVGRGDRGLRRVARLGQPAGVLGRALSAPAARRDRRNQRGSAGDNSGARPAVPRGRPGGHRGGRVGLPGARAWSRPRATTSARAGARRCSTS